MGYSQRLYGNRRTLFSKLTHMDSSGDMGTVSALRPYESHLSPKLPFGTYITQHTVTVQGQYSQVPRTAARLPASSRHSPVRDSFFRPDPESLP